MPIDPLAISEQIQSRFRRYLETTFPIPTEEASLREQFRRGIRENGRHFRGPYLHGLAPYVRDRTVADLVRDGVLPREVTTLPLLASDRPLYRHQVEAITRARQGRNVIVSSGTGSGKTLTFLTPILASILERPQEGVHALLLYPMNALVNDQLKNLRRVLRDIPQVRFGRYINRDVTPQSERDGRRLHSDAPPNEVVSREVFRSDPPHLLVTNYSMLEYLLLRVDDSPLFVGPWRFVVLDEAHTYGGTKGSEVALLLRRLIDRVKPVGAKPPQYVATSASLGTDDPERRREVFEFARTLFNAPFEEGDLISAMRDHTPASGGTLPDPAVYLDPAVASVAVPGGKWTPQASGVLLRAGFGPKAVAEAERLATTSVEEALHRVFQEDDRVRRLRQAVDQPRDLASAAKFVLGSDDELARERLCGLVRVANLARVPGGDSRLVPCRYHLFVRGLNGAHVALAPVDGEVEPTLFLEPMSETPDGRQALPLQVCRKCGQTYLRAGVTAGSDGDRLSPADREGVRWLTWSMPARQSDDENDETSEETPPAFPEFAFHTRSGRYRKRPEILEGDEVAVWEVHRERELNRCVGCGGSKSVSPLRADSEAAQAVVTDSFYRALPEATSPPARAEALNYPGRGRKLLAFADNRQSAAYFAPYIENTNRQQLMRSLVYRAAVRASSRGDLPDPETLVERMLRLGGDDGWFPDDAPKLRRQTDCARATVVEFALPMGRRQSLEALALIAATVELKGRWYPPKELLQLLGEETMETVTQLLLATVRQAKAITLPEELTVDDPAFAPVTGQDGFDSRGSEAEFGYRLHGFAPASGVAPHRQRRAAYLERVVDSATRANGIPRIDSARIAELLDEIWKSLISHPRAVLARSTLAKGVVGYQLKWDAVRLNPYARWFVCDRCRQWTPFDARGVCPSFRCVGTLRLANPDELLRDHHYRRMYRLAEESPLPLVAREHTAQLGPKLATEYQLAFQDGHHPDQKQINLLSSSTTFELGVDLGDLEAVVLRNVPPSPANYQQRAGRAGRGVGSAAFVVTFAMSRSHDEHFFGNPPEMIDGQVRPPRIDLRNELLYSRHIHAVLLAQFVADRREATGQTLTTISDFLPEAVQPVPMDEFLDGLPEAVERNREVIELLLPASRRPLQLAVLIAGIRGAMQEAREHFSEEVRMYTAKMEELRTQVEAAEKAGNNASARKLSNFRYVLQDRLNDFRREDWVSYLSGRSVLPSYAFPIYNVSLETSDRDLKLERDLRLALSEYVPGAAIVARGKLWRSVGIRKPVQKTLRQQFYAECPHCHHVMRNLDVAEIFPRGACPVCGDDGVASRRKTHRYLVPAYGFTTDTAKPGEELRFDGPQRIPTSRVLFVPQQQTEDPLRGHLGDGPHQVRVYSTEKANFFVFNDGEDRSRLGFRLCRSCGRQVEVEKSAKSKGSPERVKPHDKPWGGRCNGESYEWTHFGHEFLSSAARLHFGGTGRDYGDDPFWLSLLHAVLGGMADALSIEASDMNGVIRPVGDPAGIIQEIVIFDDVPGGAGHALRLESDAELRSVLRAALDRVEKCECGETTSCYKCLRSYRNQFCHESLARGPVAEYLARLLRSLELGAGDDRPYPLPDRVGALRTAIRDARLLDVIVDRLDPGGAPEARPWHELLAEAARRPGTRARLALRSLGERGFTIEGGSHILALVQNGVEVRSVRDGASPAPYAILARAVDARSVAFRTREDWVPLDGEFHRRELWFNRAEVRIAEAGGLTDEWFEEQTSPILWADLLGPKPSEDYVVHPFKKGARVDFRPVFSGLAGESILGCDLQDPYLLTLDQVEAFAAFLRAVPWATLGSPIPFRLTTALADDDPRKHYQLSSVRQKQELEARVAVVPSLALTLNRPHPRYSALHMRFIRFRLDSGERIYLLERGLDIADPKTGWSRNDSFILEFRKMPMQLASVLGR